MDTEYERYKRHLTLTEVGEEGQKLLSNASVLIVGCGGLGVLGAQYLAGAGVGRLFLCDGDAIELSNLHRQITYTQKEVGLSKAIVATERAQELNPQIKAIAVDRYLTHENGIELLEDVDLVLDCTDNFEARYLINDMALLHAIPVVCGSLHKFEAQLTVYNYEQGPTYRCLFPNENSRGFGCPEVGVLGPLAGMLGSYMALEAMKIILKKGEKLSGRVGVFNGLTHTWHYFSYSKDEGAVRKRIEYLENARKRQHYG
ncbi:MAG: HesA/MoeB/ThiF family protein [Bacteroidota bacterium]